MFFQNARIKGQNGIMNFLMTAVLIIFCYMLSSVPFILYAYKNGISQEEAVRYSGPWPFALMLFVFAGLLVGVLLGTKYVHRRSPLSVLTGAPKFRWSHAAKGAGIWFAILTVMEVMSYIAEPEMYHFQFEAVPFFLCLLVAVSVLPLQTSAEEVLIRGYLMQQTSLLSAYRWIPVLVTAVIFGLLHGGNPEVVQYGLIKSMALYIGMGLFFGLTVAIDDGLELALGMHYINNFYALVFVGYQGSVFDGTPTLFMKQSEDLTTVSVVSNLILMFAVLLLFKRIFRWPGFGHLFTKMRIPE